MKARFCRYCETYFESRGGERYCGPDCRKKDKDMEDAGAYHERIRIEQNVAQRSASGARVDNWTTFASRWARAIPKGSREFERAWRTMAEVTQAFAVRGPLAATALMRVVHGERVFDVVGVETEDGRPAANCYGEVLLACAARAGEAS